jgi:hypothetical protein
MLGGIYERVNHAPILRFHDFHHIFHNKLMINEPRLFSGCAVAGH